MFYWYFDAFRIEKRQQTRKKTKRRKVNIQPGKSITEEDLIKDNNEIDKFLSKCEAQSLSISGYKYFS